MDQTTTDRNRLALHAMHEALGARMVPFAGHLMPLQYAGGIVAEHAAAREGAALFDVSHMGQVLVAPRDGDPATAAAALERLVPANLVGLAEGRQRYGLLLNDEGGIVDDLMAARRADGLLLVVNASRIDADLPLLWSALGGTCEVRHVRDRALLALQGPSAERVLAPLVPEAADMRFMDHRVAQGPFGELWISRSGYTGEDGFEISVPEAGARALADALIEGGATPAGLGARDTLRLEAGLCLYGQDMDEGTTPAEAGLAWAIPKVRRADGARAGGFPGAGRVLAQIEEGAPRTRVGLRPEGRAPLRHGAVLYAAPEGGAPVGEVTSGAFGPTLGAPVAMARVEAGLAGPLYGELRGRRVPAQVVPLPFVAPRFKR